MKILTVKALLIFFVMSSMAHANNGDYWLIKIPVFDGALNVSNEKDQRSYVISSSYDIKIQNTKELYTFYSNYFEGMGWNNPTKDFSRPTNEHQGGWSSYRTTYTPEGRPESAYSSLWKAKDIPALGTVIVTVTGYNEGVFEAKVLITIAPEVDTSPLHKLHSIIIEDPKNIFVLHEAVGGNPFDIDKVNPKPIKKYENNKVVKEYYKLIYSIIEQYREFGTKYVKK